MRFLRKRQITNKRQLQVKNWLLLALRVAAIGLLAALFARPSVDTLAMGDWLRTLLLPYSLRSPSPHLHGALSVVRVGWSSPVRLWPVCFLRVVPSSSVFVR